MCILLYLQYAWTVARQLTIWTRVLEVELTIGWSTWRFGNSFMTFYFYNYEEEYCIINFSKKLSKYMRSFQGGGWCNNVTTCLARKNSRLGSSKEMSKLLAFSGILNNKASLNPGSNICSFKMDDILSEVHILADKLFLLCLDFYNWNKIKVRYCDGASFTGDVEAVNPVSYKIFIIHTSLLPVGVVCGDQFDAQKYSCTCMSVCILCIVVYKGTYDFFI